MTEPRTVCRVCGEENVSPCPKCGYDIHQRFPWVTCSTDESPHAHPYQPVTIQPCETCGGSGVTTPYGSLTYGPCPACTMLDGKPSPFPGWVVA